MASFLALRDVVEFIIDQDDNRPKTGVKVFVSVFYSNLDYTLMFASDYRPWVSWL